MGLAAGIVGELDHVGDWGLLATDADLVVAGWNRWLEQRTGRAAADALGRPLFELFPDLPARRLDRYYRQALAGQTVILSQRLHKYVLPLPPSVEGGGLDRMQQVARIVPLGDGPAVAGTLTIIEDVTERVVYEAELRSRARRQAALAALARAALAGRDVADVAREAIAHFRETLDLGAAEVLELLPDGASWGTLAAAGWVVPPAATFAAAAAPRTEPALTSEAAVVIGGADDPFLKSHRVAAGVVVRVPGAGDRPFGLLGGYARTPRRFAAEDLQFARAMADVLGSAADRKRLEAELRVRVGELAEADRRKDEFLAMLAHELRNPLAPIHNAVQILKRMGPSDPALHSARDMIDRQVGHMVRLVDDLLDVSRITRRRVNLRTEWVELAAVVTRAVEAARPLIDARRHDLTLALPPDPVYLDADPTRLAQVFGNLLTNAAKYTEEGGRIWLTASREGAEAVVRVRDTGVGIPADMLPRVFDLFVQADRTLDRAQGGLGIGLTLVKNLVELHGGAVTAASDGPGRGSEFVVRLPAARVGAPPTQSRGRAADAPGEPAAHSILIVDDNVDSAESLAILLRGAGHEVWTAHDGPGAITAAREHRPGVVLLDIGLPQMDGYEVARWLKREADFAGVLLIAMTGYSQEADRRKAREAGFDHHLIKPADAEEIHALLSRRCS